MRGEAELAELHEAALLARDQGLHVHMGHGLNYDQRAGGRRRSRKWRN